VFLAKATLQQYLSRSVRKDWNGVRRLTHPKALAAAESTQRAHELAPWRRDALLKTFEFRGARQVAPGIVAVAVVEDLAGNREQIAGSPAVYLLFKARNGFLVGDRKPGAELGDVREPSVRQGYPDWVDPQMRAQARRVEPPRGTAHR
jgi:hypothetical protein